SWPWNRAAGASNGWCWTGTRTPSTSTSTRARRSCTTGAWRASPAKPCSAWPKAVPPPPPHRPAMSIRLSIISTRTGDDGTTGLGDGSRLPKSAPLIHALGDVDELNSQIGVLRTLALPADVDALLSDIQHDLFDMGAELCIPGHQV